MTDGKTWRHDADGYAYKTYRDAAGLNRRQYADAAYLYALEARAALVDEAAHRITVLEQALRDARDGIESMARSCMDPTSTNWKSFLTGRAENALVSIRAALITTDTEEN